MDITRSAVENANLVIAQVNPCMPRAWGDSLVHMDNFDYFVPHEEPLVTYHPNLLDKNITSRIGRFISQLVRDSDTLQIGFGTPPLFEQNVVTNRLEILIPRRVNALLCMGTEKLYRLFMITRYLNLVHRNSAMIPW